MWARVDFFTRVGPTKWAGVEVKYGNAKPSLNQRFVYASIAAGNAYPVGTNAVQAGFSPGQQVIGTINIERVQPCEDMS